jgi:NADH:ubiquinone oxidoreductase subunit H
VIQELFLAASILSFVPLLLFFRNIPAAQESTLTTDVATKSR